MRWHPLFVPAFSSSYLNQWSEGVTCTGFLKVALSFSLSYSTGYPSELGFLIKWVLKRKKLHRLKVLESHSPWKYHSRYHIFHQQATHVWRQLRIKYSWFLLLSMTSMLNRTVSESGKENTFFFPWDPSSTSYTSRSKRTSWYSPPTPPNCPQNTSKTRSFLFSIFTL